MGTDVFQFPKEISACTVAAAFRECFVKPTSLQKVRICAADADTKLFLIEYFSQPKLLKNSAVKVYYSGVLQL